MNASFASTCLFLPLLVLAELQVVEPRPAPKFAGKSIPDPPQQRAPWTPPPTKLPRFLVSAIAALFDQGMADPRGCEYREVEIGDGTILKTRGFVLPQRAGEAGRFVVSWDGVIYPALSVGALADLDKDVRTLAGSLKRNHEAATRDTDRSDDASGFIGVSRRGGMYFVGGEPSGPDGRSALKLCLLLRLGHADLAETLFAAGTAWTPEKRGLDLTDYHISYLTLATDWAAVVFVRLVSAHIRGDDAIALDASRRLSAFAMAVDTRAEAMGFERIRNRYSEEPPAYVPFLRQLPELLADQERRAKEPARGPIPKRGGDPSARVAALIRDLDQIDEGQMMWPITVNPANAPLVRALAAEGQPALEPLLAALETDVRLTRSVAFGTLVGSIDRTVHPVFEAEFSAIEGILNTNDFAHPSDLAGRKALVPSLRTLWEKNRTVSNTERWYQMLRDDSAGRNRWFEAARGIIQPNVNTDPFAAGPRRPPSSPMWGEALRSRRDPSVSELFARRIAEIAGPHNPARSHDMDLRLACDLALIFDRWDSKAARPVLRATMTQCREEIERRRERGEQANPYLSGEVARLAVVRAGAGDREALDEYAAWIRKTVPKELEYQPIDCLAPMWTYPDHPRIAEATRWLFNDRESPWLPVLRGSTNQTMNLFHNSSLARSPLLTVPAFRDGLIAAMATRAVMGTVRRIDPGVTGFTVEVGASGGLPRFWIDVESVKPGVDLPYRVCDHLASEVSSLEGAPECELYWPEDRRDRAVAACIAYLKRFGDRFIADPHRGERDFPGKKAHLAFPALGRPATLEDVRRARAIFSLEGQGEVRPAKVPDFPIKARWVTLKDFPVDSRDSGGGAHREYEQDGWIWQAEEVRKGDRWERFFGFVGPHVIARVPAAELELGGRHDSGWGSLPGGLDAMLRLAEPPDKGYDPGQPVLAIVRIRNRRGVENASPREFLRRGDDGRPMLRRGVALAVFYSAPRITRSEIFPGRGGPEEALKPKRTDRFDPRDPARPLAPFEEFEAMRLDLNDWFDLSRPGSYHAQVTLAADSGVGAGATNDWYFTVGNQEDFVP